MLPLNLVRLYTLSVNSAIHWNQNYEHPPFLFFKSPKNERPPPINDSDVQSGKGLSYFGEEDYQELRTKQAVYHKFMWNVTQFKVIGYLQHTPGPSIFTSKLDPKEGHSDWFP